METPKLGPIRAARLLRADLRRAREVAVLTQADLARRLGWSGSKVARIENGDVSVSRTDLDALSSVLGLGEAIRRELERLAGAARQRGWWHEDRRLLSGASATLLGLEAEAGQFSEYAAGLVPSLLRTASYAAAYGDLDLLPERQRRFWNRADGPRFEAVIDEAVLFRRVGGPAVMAEQVRRLAEVARRPQVELRILPFESQIVRKHSYVVVSDEMIGHLVYADLHNGDWVWEGGTLGDEMTDHFASLRAASLDPDRTGQLLHRVAAGYGAGGLPRPWLWS
ncbi:helix-turn-helix domain-containing protein [Actinoplanes sp. CA-131856]